MRKWLLLVLLSCAIHAARAEEFTGKVIAVLDGDTVLVLRNNTPVKIRLADIDAPEVGHAGTGGLPPNSQKAQAWGMESKQSLSGMVLKKQISVNVQAVDQYGRLVAHLALDGRSVNEEQVRRGMAWEYSNFHSNKTYIALQSDAQQARRGLWAQDNPMAPWQWRKLHAADVPSIPAAARPQPPVAQKSATIDYVCGSKHRCVQMSSCDEALFYYTHCGVKVLDRDGDGMPCEKLCGGRK